MLDVESALRGAMADDVAAVTAPPDLAGRVRERHRRRRRVRVAATLAGTAAAVIAVPVIAVSVVAPDGPPAGAAVDQVDGVELTYLPPGLRRAETDGWDSSDVVWYPSTWRGETEWTATTGRWYPEDPGAEADPPVRGLRLTVFRGSAALRLDDVVGYAWRWWDTGVWESRVPSEPPAPDADGRVRVVADGEGWNDGSETTPPYGWWRDVYWSPEPGVVLRVGAGAELADEIEAVVDGVGRIGPGQPPPWPLDGLCRPATRSGPAVGGEDAQTGAFVFGGVRVGYLPDSAHDPRAEGQHGSGIFDVGYGGSTWFYAYSWDAGGTGETDPADVDHVTVTVTCGEAAQDLDTVHQFNRNMSEQWWRDRRPYPEVNGRPAILTEHENGRTVQWLERPGAVIGVYVAQRLLSELDEVIAGIEIEP